MQSDPSSTSTVTRPGYSDSYTTTGEKQFTDYMADIGCAVSTGAGQAYNFFTERPLLTGSIIVGGLGAFMGNRLAYSIAERRRKTAYDKALETIGYFSTMMSSWLSPRNREEAIKRISHTGRDVLGYTQELGGTMMEKIPFERASSGRIPLGKIPVIGRAKHEEKPGIIRQIGYGLSLIPVTLAAIRNPLVRDIAFRLMSSRIRHRRRHK